MRFNSFAFLFAFFPSVFVLQRLAKRSAVSGAAQATLLFASLAFYAWADPAHVPVLIGSVLFNLFMGRAICAVNNTVPRRRRLFVGLAGNVLLLGTLKYSGFVLSNVNEFTGLKLSMPGVWFALGVSFFTIQQIMYLVDCYEGLVEAHDLLDHASFVIFFPTISSGPLTRSRQLVPQLKDGRGASAEEFGRGLYLFGLGLGKKVVIADCIGRIADTGFANVETLTGPEAWITCTVYCLQIYFDFSGYSDMAIGTAQMLGINLPINFNAPYRSLSIIEFWQRWHITLSKFITVYLFTPLVRLRRKATLLTTSLATLAAMTIAGLWHGPAWTFVIFGVIHGIALVINQLWRKVVKRRVPATPSWVLTMTVVLVGFVFFRSPSAGAALSMGRALLFRHHEPAFAAFKSVIRMADLQLLALPMVLAAPLALFGPDSNEAARRLAPGIRTALGTVALLLISFLFLNSTIAQDFVYFAF